jgi:glycosyltransferase involved in cell wall biosynthesis
VESEQTRTFESLFRQSIYPVMEHVRTLQNIELVVGIPFYNEKDTLSDVLQMIENNLPERYREHTLVLSVGDPAGAGCLEAIRQLNLKVNHFEFLMNPGSNGRGASIRAIFEAAKYLVADVVLLAADVRPGEGGLDPDCINLLLAPLRNGYDMAVAILDRPYWGDMVSKLFTVILLEMFYSCEVSTPDSGIYSLSHDLVEDCCTDIKFWGEIPRGFGIDLWLITRAIRWKKRTCEVQLGAKPTVSTLAKVNQVFKETAEALFECIKKDEDFWSAGRLILKRLDRFDFHNIDRVIDSFSTSLFPGKNGSLIQAQSSALPNSL